MEILAFILSLFFSSSDLSVTTNQSQVTNSALSSNAPVVHSGNIDKALNEVR